MTSRSVALRFGGVVLVMAAFAGCTKQETPAPPPPEPTFYQDLARPDAVVDAEAAASMISGFRGNNNLGPVAVDPELMRFAREQAEAMAARNNMDHDAARPFQERIKRAGLSSTVAVENISAGYHTLAEAFSGWRDSPPHRTNMLTPAVTRLGIAAVYAPQSKYKVFWALVLAGSERRAQTPYRWDR